MSYEYMSGINYYGNLGRYDGLGRYGELGKAKAKAKKVKKVKKLKLPKLKLPKLKLSKLKLPKLKSKANGMPSEVLAAVLPPEVLANLQAQGMTPPPMDSAAPPDSAAFVDPGDSASPADPDSDPADPADPAAADAAKLPPGLVAMHPGMMVRPGMRRPGMAVPTIKPIITSQQARLGAIAAALGAGLMFF